MNCRVSLTLWLGLRLLRTSNSGRSSCYSTIFQYETLASYESVSEGVESQPCTMTFSPFRFVR